MSTVLEQRAGIRHVRAYCSLCSVDCPIVCTLEEGRVTKVEADLRHPLGGAMCIKGRAAPELLYHPDRLKYPLRRTRPKGDPDPGWERISWDEALEAIAQRLLAIRAESGPQAVAFPKATNGGTAIGDSDRWLRRLASAFGSPNQVSTTHVCNWHKDTASKYTYGVTIPKPDFERTQCVILWGHNPSATSIDYAIAITAARKRGAKLVVIDPRRVGLANQADCWLPVRPGADGALALSLIHVFIEEGLYDAEFVRRWTNGPFLALPDGSRLVTEAAWAAMETGRAGAPAPTAVGAERRYAVWDRSTDRLAWYDAERGVFEGADVEPALERGAALSLGPSPNAGGRMDGGSQATPTCCPTVFDLLRRLAAEYAPERAEEITGVPAAEVRRAARLVGAHRPVCYYAWNGVGQHTNATQTSRAISTFYALTGSFDAPGGNVIYKGVATNDVAGWGLVPPETALLRLGRDERPLGPPADPGAATAYDLFHAILDGKPYRVRAALSFGSNTLLSSSDSVLGREALAKLEFFAIAELFLTPTAEMADIVLPVSTFLERPALKSETEKSGRLVGHLRYRPAAVAPLGEARSDDEICFDLAVRLGLGGLFWEGDIEAAYRYQLAPSGVSLEELKQSDTGVVLETPPRFRKYEQVKDTGVPQGFATPTKRIELFSTRFAEHGFDPLPRFEEPSLSPRRTPEVAKDYPLILTNAKDTHYNHSQMRGLPTLRRAVPHPPAEVHADTAAEYGLAAGDWVLIETPYGAARFRLKVTRRIRPGVVCANHGWWQTNAELGLPGYDPFSEAGSNLNLLFSHDRRDPISGSLPYRAFLCRLRKVDEVLGPES